MEIYNIDKDGSYGNWKEKANRAFSYKVAMGDVIVEIGDHQAWILVMFSVRPLYTINSLKNWICFAHIVLPTPDTK